MMRLVLVFLSVMGFFKGIRGTFKEGNKKETGGPGSVGE